MVSCLPVVIADIGVKYPIGDSYDVTLVSIVYDPIEDKQTWTYNITCNDDPDISHFVFEFAEVCDPPLSSILGTDPVVDDDDISDNYTDTFPHEGVAGIKFDLPVVSGDYRIVSFTLDGEWPDGTMTFWLKAGALEECR
jgi:hypothetical protein